MREGPALEMPAQSVVFRPVAYVLASLSVVLTAFLASDWFHRWSHPASNDFAAFYAAGRLTAAGRLGSVYSLATIERLERSVATGSQAVRLAFPYPPQAAGLLSLFARLDINQANLAWTATNLAAFIAAVTIALARVERRWRLVGGLLAAGCVPIVMSTAQGESSGILTLGIVLALFGFQRAIALAPAMLILSFKPQLLVVPLVALAIRRNKDEVAWTAVGLLAAAALSVAAGGLTGVQAFLRLAIASTHWTTQFHWGAPFNYSLLAQLHAFLGYGLLSTALWILLGVAVIVGYAKCGGFVRPVWLPLACLCVLLANHFMFHDLAILYPAVIVALGTRLQWWGLALVACMWLDPGLYPVFHVHVITAACLAIVLVALFELSRTVTDPTTMNEQAARSLNSSWKSFGPVRWGSASGSETPST